MQYAHIDTKQADATMDKFRKSLSVEQIAKASRMALNDSIRKGKVEMRKAITSVYNLKAATVNNINSKKGLSVKLSTNKKLEAVVNAGHQPVNLSSLSVKFKSKQIGSQISYQKNGKQKRTAAKRSIGVISVEVLKGAGYKPINTAFSPGVVSVPGKSQAFTKAIFARGKKGSPTFMFGKDRMPIDSITSVSVATAAYNTTAQQQVIPTISATYEKELTRQLNRLVNETSNSNGI